MNEQTRDDHSNPLWTLAIIAVFGVIIWAIVRKRATRQSLISAVIAPAVPLVSSWSPLP